MFLDKRNNKKVSIERDSQKGVVIVKEVKTGKRYLIEKTYLIDLDKK